MENAKKIIRCSICNKELEDFKPEDKKYPIYSTRIDKRLPGEKSHFKHIHVTYVFCSEACYKKFLNKGGDLIENNDKKANLLSK